MKILASTKDTQGRRENDFCFVPEGEPVVLRTFVCDDKADDVCGCARSMSGIFCKQSTTTVKVIDAPLTSEGLKWYALSGHIVSGWTVDKQTLSNVALMIDDLLAEADKHEVGEVLEYREGVFSARK